MLDWDELERDNQRHDLELILDARPRYYRRNGEPYPAGNEGLFEWARDFGKLEDRIVARTWLWNGLYVSTIWLGLDHSFRPWGPPQVFESQVHDWMNTEHRYGHEITEILEQCRYSNEEEAIRGHEELCQQWSALTLTLGYWWRMATRIEENYDD